MSSEDGPESREETVTTDLLVRMPRHKHLWLPGMGLWSITRHSTRSLDAEHPSLLKVEDLSLPL
jgi:hypothetical protein